MPGVALTGFVAKTEPECVQEIIDEARSTVDPEYDDSPDSVTGGFATIIGSKHAELWSVLAVLYGALSPNASGIHLDRVAAYSNTKRKPASATLLYVTLTGANGTYAPGALDLTVDGQSAHFSNRDALVISSGTGQGFFLCDTTGPVRVGIGTLGPNVTSFTESSIGQVAEPDARLRVRRRAELADEGNGTVPALRAALSKLSNVEDVRVYTNRTMVTDAHGLPPKSVEALVLATDTSPAALLPIAETIWQNLDPGIEAHGTWPVHVQIVDEEGNAQSIALSCAEPGDPWTRVTLEVNEAAYAGDAVLKQVLHDFSAGFIELVMNGVTIAGKPDLGGTIYRSRLAAAALTVPGVTGVTKVEFSSTGVTYADADYVLGAREYLGNGADRGLRIARMSVVTT